jgi:hypothetical protein
MAGPEDRVPRWIVLPGWLNKGIEVRSSNMRIRPDKWITEILTAHFEQRAPDFDKLRDEKTDEQ